MRGRLIGRDALFRALVARTGSAGGVVLTGPAGVGKSRLLDELLQHPRLESWARHRFVGNEPSRSVAFGSLFSLLPETAPDDRAQLLARLRSSLLDGASGRRVLVAVDDAHLLDEQSSAFLAELAHRADATLAMTQRSGHALPSPLMGLLRSATVERVAVEPLDDAATRALAEEVLGGAVTTGLAAAIAELSGGLPLLAR
jgi:predicted ATPase